MTDDIIKEEIEALRQDWARKGWNEDEFNEDGLKVIFGRVATAAAEEGRKLERKEISRRSGEWAKKNRPYLNTRRRQRDWTTDLSKKMSMTEAGQFMCRLCAGKFKTMRGASRHFNKIHKTI